MIWNPDFNESDYTNPIIYTDYSDPDAIRVGDDYYMTASSFNNVPGLPVLHSRDLIHWDLISYALNRIPDESYNAVRHGCGVWAPAIRYHDGKFYICFPMPDEGIYMVTAENAAGPWSEPVQLFAGKGFIDPCPFWDDDGRAYLVNGVAKSRIGYKSVLYMSEMSPDGKQLISSPTKIYDGSLDGNDTCEGPKLYKRNGFYYVLAPAGGVKVGWQLALRSKNIYGPYEVKRIMYQGSTGVNGPHQGAWIDTPSGDWFLHFQDVFAAGRIVHLQPLEWRDDWPFIGEPKLRFKKPTLDNKGSNSFSCKTLQWQWNANPNSRMEESRLSEESLELYSAYNPEDCAVCNYPNLLLRKWEAPAFEVTGKLDLSCSADNDKCGIVSLGMEYLSIELKRVENKLQVYKVTGKINGEEQRLLLLEMESDSLDFNFSINVKPTNSVTATSPKPEYSAGMEFQVLHPEESVFISLFRDNGELLVQEKVPGNAGRWVGAKYGFYCTASEKSSSKMGKFYINLIQIK